MQPDICGATNDLELLLAAELKFGTIYADPPWQYTNSSTRNATDYRTMSLDEICALPIAQLSADTCHLHLWTTNAYLFDAKKVIEAWGFSYKSCFVWVKPQIGMGNYWRVSHEFMLLGTRGPDATFHDRTLRSWIKADRGIHSGKPDIVRTMIEGASPGPHLELFARYHTQGWVTWGDEIAKDLYYKEIEL